MPDHQTRLNQFQYIDGFLYQLVSIKPDSMHGPGSVRNVWLPVEHSTSEELEARGDVINYSNEHARLMNEKQEERLQDV